jgi:NADPH-dependent 2,4-dienoyl-CoA reductase/sulfur reductase-like enzyme
MPVYRSSWIFKILNSGGIVEKIDCVVVGAGVIGLAVAAKLAQ